MRRLSFRTRLTLGHAVAVAAILLLAVLVADWRLRRTVLEQVDAALVAVAEAERASAIDAKAVHVHEIDPSAELERIDVLVQISDLDGTVLDRRRHLGNASLPVSQATLARNSAGETVIETVLFGGEQVRLASLPVSEGERIRYSLQVGTPLAPTRALLHTARIFLFAMSAVILAAVVIVGGLLARSALRPIGEAAASAERIGRLGKSERLQHPGGDDELARLIETLNRMLDRVERSISAHRRFTADASHELRSPLSRLRLELEVASRHPRSPEEYRETLRSCQEEVARLSRLTDTLLTLARLDAGEADAAISAPAPVAALLAAERARLEPEASRRKVRLALEPCLPLWARIPSEALSLITGNLIENAIKFSPRGGRVELSARGEGGTALFTVSDEGPGVPQGSEGRIFERFFRADAARSHEVSGFGLGLAICHALAQAYGGGIEFERRPTGGSTFTVRLPLANEPGAAPP